MSNNLIKLLWILISAFLTCCQNYFPPKPVNLHYLAKNRERNTYIAQGKKAMVVSAHPFATQAGLKILLDGGNAVDAAVATSFVLAVVRPQSTGLGGGGFLLYFDNLSKDISTYDFRERAPLAATKNMFLDEKSHPKSFDYNGYKIPKASLNGHLSVGVPGFVAGLISIHKNHGSMELRKLLAPSIKIAKEGFPVYQSLANAIKKRKSILEKFRATKNIFFKNNQPLKKNDILIQKDLARTLHLIAKNGSSGFYKGHVAKQIIKEMKQGKGILTQKDLEQYKVKKREPIHISYKNYKVISMPPPSSGGVHIGQILKMIEKDPIDIWGPQDVRSIHLLTEAMKRAYADRAYYLGDPDFVQIPLKKLLSSEYIANHRKNIDFNHATRSIDIKKPIEQVKESSSTTHISIVDPTGSAVTTTQTINYSFGSGVVVPETGIVLNNEMDDFSISPGTPNAYGLVGSKANSIEPGKTMLSSMSPTFVFDENKNLKLILGSPGGSRIITAVVQTIINYVTYKMSLEDSAHYLRFHHQWLPDTLYTENFRLKNNVRSKLLQLGHKISPSSYSMGDIQAISKEHGFWKGVSDTRSDGVPMGF